MEYTVKMANIDKYQEVLKKQDSNITFYIRHRVRLLQLLSDLRNGKLTNLDPINETLINLEKRKLVMSQHLKDLDMDYYHFLQNEDPDKSEELSNLNDKIESLTSKLTQINRYKSDLEMINKLVTKEFQQDSINISKSKIEELFKLENDEEYQLIFRKSELIDPTNEIYKFNKIDFNDNLKTLSEQLKKEKQDCDDLKNKIENDRLIWQDKQQKFIQLYTSYF